MEIKEAQANDREKWNKFVIENFPPVGAFFQSWEWGDFKARLGHSIKRYVIQDGKRWVWTVSLEEHSLPLGFKYHYTPRGPVALGELWQKEEYLERVFRRFEEHFRNQNPKSIFLRLEPPISKHLQLFLSNVFRLSRYYVQPKASSVVDITFPEESLFKTFSRDMRHDLRAAIRSGIKVDMRAELNANDYKEFRKMQEETRERARKNIFPNEDYFKNFFLSFQPLGEKPQGFIPERTILFAYNNSQPVAAHIVIFFGSTATYLFGASYSGKVSSKASSYLHWASVKKAKEAGFKWYDVGGVDPVRWPTLTYFKNQFRGTTVEYVGNVDLVFKPKLYQLYNLMRRFRYRD